MTNGKACTLISTPSEWATPPSEFHLQSGHIHVWRLRLNASPDTEREFRKILSSDELKRADRFIRKEHGLQFLTGRATLRHLLATYIGVSPEEIDFEYNKFGKPSLKISEHNITFNVSNTKTLAVIAITRENPVGIDIEQHRERLELEKIARRYFSESEVDALFSLKPEDRAQAFYRCWSSKEAFMKVCGLGLSIGLNRFDVEVQLDKPPSVLRVPKDMGNPDQWQMRSLPMQDEVAGIVALEGKIETINLYDLDPATLL